MLEAAPKWLQRALCLPFPPKPLLRRGPPLALQGALAALAPVISPVLPTPRCATGSIHALQHRYRLQSTSAWLLPVRVRMHLPGSKDDGHGTIWLDLPFKSTMIPTPNAKRHSCRLFFSFLYTIALILIPAPFHEAFSSSSFCFFLLRRLAFATRAP